MKKVIILMLLILITGCITINTETHDTEQPIPEPPEIDTNLLAGSWTGDFSEEENGITCDVIKRGEATLVFLVDGDRFEGTFFAEGSRTRLSGPEFCGGDFSIGGSMEGVVGGSELTGVFKVDGLDIEIPFTATYTGEDLIGGYDHSDVVEGEFTSFEGAFFLDRK